MEASYTTRQDIENFPFPYKLWLVIHLDFCDFLRWSRDGTVVLLDLVALQDYLNSTRSIFHIKNRSSFLDHLEEFQFERLNATPEPGEDLFKELIMNFFGDYLPTYENGSMEVKKIIGESGASNSNVLSSEHEVPQSKMQKYFEVSSLNMDSTSTSTRQSNFPPLNFSSSLEPIFKTDEEQDDVNYMQEGITVAQINQNHMDTEVDISMDEFLKFKDTTYANLVSRTTREVEARPHEINYPTTTVEQAAAPAHSPDFPQMPTAVKMEITEQEDCCCIIGILALDFVLAKPWCDGLNVRSEEDLTISQTESVLICSICRNELDPKRNFYRTIYDHVFHKSCLKACLNKSQLCPNCQTNLPVEDIFGQILTRQQTRLLDSSKAVMANTPDVTPQSQSLSPELTQQISEMVLSSVQAQQSKLLKD
uniref:RING-type domain-containing protein n=1 Tax=Glossina austeni TaxID=7395 RepID=A0A1A9VI77_GLOAU